MPLHELLDGVFRALVLSGDLSLRPFFQPVESIDFLHGREFAQRSTSGKAVKANRSNHNQQSRNPED